MTNFKYKKIINICIILFILIGIMGVYLNKTMYNKLVVIEDKEQVLQYSSNSIPVKIDFYSKRRGKVTISSSNILKEFWSIVDSMPRSKNFYNSKIENSSNEITGTIYYLDGKKGTLYLNNNLRINDIYYGGDDSSAYTNRLRNYINNIFCTPSVLSELINDKNKITIVDIDNNTKKCGSNDKTLIKNKVMELQKITDNKKLEKAISDKGNLNYHIRIYREDLVTTPDNSSEYEKNSYDIISIDIYENDYVVIRDYGDEIVNSFYMQGNLNDLCNNLFNQ
ncbi:DUF3919 family protein [Clostridium uliginosum]|uniref:DUF3919 family protein n=1 Tax=Clostridium uliginosum TaxID=119641 RepID=A0A1I1JBV2_9CLOT|nr:DUF3919 family protein [Clostridium uliginosum]SFC43433.1 Protein of unknown function [Clostridium uliginosum]